MGVDDTLHRILKLVLRPVVHFCLRSSMGLHDLIGCAKEVFVEVAASEISKRGEKVNVSRITTLTGVHRKDVAKIHNEEEPLDLSMQIGRRVIAQWRRDKRFLDRSGKPRVLGCEGPDCEFSRLVRIVSKEIGYAAVLFQLEQINSLQRTPAGVRLKVKGYQPDRKSLEIYRLLAEDVEDLMQAVMVNIDCEEKILPNIHVKVQFDNIDRSDIPKIRSWFHRNCFRWHQAAERFLAKFDLDITPNKDKQGGERVALGIVTRT